MSESNKAVFMSYASQDAEAAKRIAEALRAGGVEVWFDQSELRGGEAWDRSIRRQIRECALFMPLISARTQARPEGYFRLEWHLAEQRSLLIAKGRPFIIPVGIDTTIEGDALVPDVFLAVQWTRLPEGATPPAFVEQVKRLLSVEQGARSRELGLGSASPGKEADPKEGPPRIPDYDLLRLIGQGSYGDVWLARGLTGIYRAIKVVWRERFTDAQPYEREFRGLKEFAAISLGESIQMALLHVGRNDEAGFFYYVMELADDVDRGRDIDPSRYVPLTLSEVRSRQGRARVPAKDCLTYGVELARVLAGLHKRGLIHRDIKPSNVIFVGGVPKLADIGLVTTADATMTYVGTEGFVPPEGPGSASADVFALGKLLYELATGLDRQEFPQLPPELKNLTDSRLLMELNEIILRACDPVAGQRYCDGASLLADLVALQTGTSVRRRRVGSGLFRAAAALAVVATVAAVSWWQWRRATPAQVNSSFAKASEDGSGLPAAPDPKSVAVLPFTNLSSDKEQEYFSDGISEELITVLQQIPGLRVIARASAFSFKESKVTAMEIGQKLGVAHLVEGSVRRAGNEVRITVRLSRAATGEQLWSESFTRNLKDVFAVQSEIAQTVVAALRGQLTEGAAKEVIQAQVRAAGKGGTKNVEAYEQYLQGRFYTNQFSKDNLERAVGLFRRAVEFDPAFALAWVALAQAHMIQAGFSNSGAENNADIQRARLALDRALTLAPDLPDALGTQARMQLVRDFDWRGAVKSVRQALALAPANPTFISMASNLAGKFGQTDHGIELIRKMLILDPLNVNARHHLANYYSQQGRFKEAEVERRRVIELSPEAFWGYASLAEEFVIQGRFDEAVETAKKEKLDWAQLTILAIARWGQKNVAESDAALHQLVTTKADIAAYQIAEVYAYRRDFDQAFAWLERAYQQRDGGLSYSRLSLMLPNLHADPRWPVFLRKLGLHDEQIAEYLADLPLPVSASAVASPLSAPAPVTLSLTPAGQAQTDPKSVAVLAFANLSDDKGNEYFSDGISEELLTVLQKIPGLRVTGRTSAFSFKGTKATATEIGQKLGVAHLVEGSVRRAGDEVRITVSLSRAATGEQLWTESFTRKLKDIFALQSEIAETVVAQIRGQLSGGAPDAAALAVIRAQVRAAERGGTKNVAAHELYLQGRVYHNQLTGDTVTRAATCFQRAVEIDPGYALAWAALSAAHGAQATSAETLAEYNDHNTQGRRALERALALDPDLPLALGFLVWQQSNLDFDWRGAERSLRRALTLAPADPDILQAAAMLANIFGQPEKVIEYCRQVMVLDPLNMLNRSFLADVYSQQGRFKEAELERLRRNEISPVEVRYEPLDYVLQGRFDEAVALAEKAPVVWIRQTMLAVAYWGQKKESEADVALNQLITTKADIAAYQVAEIYAYRGDADRAFDWLERAYRQRDGGVAYVRSSLMLRSLHADPRWPVFLRKLGLHDEQLAEFVPDFQKTVTVPAPR